MSNVKQSLLYIQEVIKLIMNEMTFGYFLTIEFFLFNSIFTYRMSKRGV